MAEKRKLDYSCAPDDGRCDVRNMLSYTYKIAHSVGIKYVCIVYDKLLEPRQPFRTTLYVLHKTSICLSLQFNKYTRDNAART
jgi:hypothetical protein